VNDVSPRFDQAVYVTDVVENNFIGAFVAQLNATDTDAGANGWIVYGLDDDDADSGSGVFDVDPDTGVVSARAVLDREMTSRYRLRVRAVDCGSPIALTGTAALVVNVVDVDDERPQFLSASYSFRVAENQPSETEVGRLLAVDADSPWNGKFYFRLRATHDADVVETLFQIDQLSGAIVTARTLDREHRASHVLVAEVLEVEYNDDDDDDDEALRRYSTSSLAAAAGRLNSTATVTIHVLDVNDNHPIFVNPKPEMLSETGSSESVLTVSNMARRDSVVATLTAVDKDEAENALVTYSIVAGNQLRLFRIDAETGNIIMNVDLAGDSDNQVNSLCIR